MFSIMHCLMREFYQLEKAATHYQSLTAAGYSVDPVNRFEDVEELCAKIGKTSQTPMFSISRLDFTREEAFWLYLHKDGEPIGCAAAKVIRLQDEAFESYLRRTSRKQYERDDDPIKSVAQPVVERIGGTLIYLGELHIKENNRGDMRALKDFVWILKFLAADKWREFDWMYAFIADEHRKISKLYNFNYEVESAIHWSDPEPPGRLSTHWFMANSRIDWEHMCKINQLKKRKPL